MRQLAPQPEPNAFQARIPSQKAFRMPNVCKSYDIPIKTSKRNGDRTDWGNLRTEDGAKKVTKEPSLRSDSRFHNGPTFDAGPSLRSGPGLTSLTWLDASSPGAIFCERPVRARSFTSAQFAPDLL